MSYTDPQTGPSVSETRPDQARPSQTQTIWADGDLANPHAASDKAVRVRSMFAAIARAYDLNNRLHALGMDVGWRKAAVRAADVKPGDAVLDVACGTGDLSGLFARMSPAGRVVGADFTPEMLELARVKQRRLPQTVSPRLRYMWADAMDLPFEDGSFDVVSIAFGIRNVQEPPRAMAEFARVLRPGGRLIVLEFDTPRVAPVRWFNNFYAGQVMPRTATLISGDRSGAYRYLPKSVSSFAKRNDVIAGIEAAGFSAPRVREMSMGICVLYRAVRLDRA
jgi:demethylmenaquinone methyltransferase/2-methoxy-6-polyprenyl-1,4-benzoquinol methylase